MVQDFIDSALIIDDKLEEVEALKKLLEANDILVNAFTPDEIKGKQLKNRKIIFLDLYLSNTATEVKGHISEIRQILKSVIGKKFGSYGIVLWSAHVEEINLLKEKLKEDTQRYVVPLFVVGLDKKKYNDTNINEIFIDLNKEIDQNTAASFFINWEILVKKGRDEAIRNIYSLEENYDLQEQNLKFILFQLAKNYNGIPSDKLFKYNLYLDAIKAFSDMLHYEINANASQTTSELFKDIQNIYFKGQSSTTKSYEYSALSSSDQSSDKKTIKKDGTLLTSNQKKDNTNRNNIKLIETEITKIYSYINSKLLIDYNNIDQSIVIPGNIYEVKAKTPLLLEEEDRPSDSIPIVIEITPPCDFAHSRMIRPRCISGYISLYSKESKPIKEYLYKEMWPLMINEKAEPHLVTFDFRYQGMIDESDLIDNSKFKLLFRTKDKLFADILQKLSSHTARLGLAIIH